MDKFSPIGTDIGIIH